MVAKEETMSWQVENIAQYVLSLGPVHVNLAKLPLGSDILLSSLYSSVEVVVCTWTESRELGHPVKLCGIYGIYGHIWYLWVPVRKKQVLLMTLCEKLLESIFDPAICLGTLDSSFIADMCCLLECCFQMLDCLVPITRCVDLS